MFSPRIEAIFTVSVGAIGITSGAVGSVIAQASQSGPERWGVYLAVGTGLLSFLLLLMQFFKRVFADSRVLGNHEVTKQMYREAQEMNRRTQEMIRQIKLASEMLTSLPQSVKKAVHEEIRDSMPEAGGGGGKNP